MIRKLKNIVRKIYDNGRRLELIEKNQEELTKLQLENYWANIFNSAVKGSTWFNNVPLNVGRWAAGYPLFYVLYRILNEIKPETILELGMGESTKMIQGYKQLHNPQALCVTVEHDKDWIEIKKRNGLSPEAISVINSELEKISVNGKETLQYKELTDQLKNYSGKFKLILIDGPFGSDNFSRHNIIELVKKDCLDRDFIIIMDDYNRQGEKETIEEVKNILKKRGTEFVETSYKGDKEFYILTVPENKYLMSL